MTAENIVVKPLDGTAVICHYSRQPSPYENTHRPLEFHRPSMPLPPDARNSRTSWSEFSQKAEHGPHCFGEKAWATEMAALAGAFAKDPPGELFRGGRCELQRGCFYKACCGQGWVSFADCLKQETDSFVVRFS